MKVADGFESVGDVIETDLVGLGYRALDENIQSQRGHARICFSELGDKLSTALDSTIRAVREMMNALPMKYSRSRRTSTT